MPHGTGSRLTLDDAHPTRTQLQNRARTGGAELIAVLNHNRPAAYLLSPGVYQAMLERLNADLRTETQQGIESGAALRAEDVFAELNVRYAEPDGVRYFFSEVSARPHRNRRLDRPRSPR